MLVPPGTIRALKNKPDALVCVSLTAVALGTLVAGAQPWPVAFIVGLAFAFYHGRRCAAEAHERASAQQRIESAAAKADDVKARHLDLLAPGQPGLPRQISSPHTRGKRR